VPLPAVCSVEGGSARLRRASLPRVLTGGHAPIVVRTAGPAAVTASGPVRTRPYRPRAKELPAPAGSSARERVLALTQVLTDREPPQTLVLDPAAAADELLARLAAWGYTP
jgi:electron transfer flavoprotein beta subunit